MASANSKSDVTSPSGSKKDELYTNAAKDLKPNKYEDYGYFFFPERFGQIQQPSWYEKFFSYGSSRAVFQKSMCEQNVQNAIEKHPGVKLLLSAMKKSGCEVNLLRHFSCEQCDSAVKGGFDPATNQTVICYNTVDSHRPEQAARVLMEPLLEAYDYCRANYNILDLKHLACSKIILCSNRIYKPNDCNEIVSHELVHAYDFCRANIDLNNNYHIACSEIRAANLTACSIYDALMNDSISIFRLKDRHKECVKRKAALSLQMVRNISESQAYKVIDEVFDKCYNDLEPFGRQVRGHADCERAYNDRKKFGFE